MAERAPGQGDSFGPAYQFGAKEARDNWKVLLDRAESGAIAVVRRNTPVVVMARGIVDAALAAQHPFSVKVAVAEDQVSMWIDGLPTHGTGASLDDAEEDFLDALVEYAGEWVDGLRFAPNHRQHGGLVQRILMYADDREEFRRVVFDDYGG